MLLFEEITKIKISRAKCVTITGIAKEIVMAHGNWCSLVRNADYH